MDKAAKKKAFMANKEEMKRGRASSRQLEVLVEYMAQHREFASGRFLSANGKVANEEMWKRVAELINELPGPSKAGSDWRKCWTDLKCNVRGRAAKAKAARGATGNTMSMVDLSEMDLKVLSIIGIETSLGHPVEEFGLPRRPEDVDTYDIIFEDDQILDLASNSSSPAASVNQPSAPSNPPSLAIPPPVSMHQPPVLVNPPSSPVNLPSSPVIPPSSPVNSLPTPAELSSTPINRPSASTPSMDLPSSKRKPTLSCALQEATRRLQEGQEVQRDRLKGIENAMNRIAEAQEKKVLLKEKEVELGERFMVAFEKAVNFFTNK